MKKKLGEYFKGEDCVKTYFVIFIVVLFLIVLVFTIGKNPIIDLGKDKFQYNLKKAEKELYLSVKRELVENPHLDISEIDVNKEEKIKKYIPNINSKLLNKVQIVNGTLYVKNMNAKEYIWSIEKGISAIGTDVKYKGTWYNPYIPSGFYHKEGTVKNGFVISDTNGNEFVWVPVDGKDVIYKNNIYTKSSVKNYDDLIKVTDSEYIKNCVKTSGGFYIGRYEAGVENSAIVTKKNKKVSNNIAVSDVIEEVKSLYTDDIKSTIPTGEMWDTMLAFIENTSDDNVEHLEMDSYQIGNYANCNFVFKDEIQNVYDKKNSASIVTTGNRKPLNNIYDIAGNVAEITLEKDSKKDTLILRGGDYTKDSITAPAVYRDTTEDVFKPSTKIGYRVALYINI